MYQIQTFLYQFLAALSAAFKDEYETVKPRAEEITNDTKQGLQQLAQAVLDGNIPLEDVPKHLEQEFLLLKTELLEAAVLGASFAEEQINELTAKFQSVLDELMKKNA